MERHLYRSNRNKMICGVCGGIGEYFNIDPTVVRLVWVLISLTYGIGILAYIIAIIVIPAENTAYDDVIDYRRSEPVFSAEKGKLVLGIGLIFLGFFILTKDYFGWFYKKFFWPLLLIAAGIILVVKNREKY